MKLKQAVIVLGLFFLTFLPRLYRLDSPIADWHSWRQTDTASVTRNFVKEGLTPLYPKFDSYFALNESGVPNPNRYFLAEFPLYNLLVYPFYMMFGVDPLYSRLVSVVFASFTSVFLYLLVRRYSSERAALLSGIFYALLPYNIFYGRVVMPDPLHIFFQVLTLYLVTVWVGIKETGDRRQETGENTSTFVWLIALGAGLAYTGALLTKPYALVLLLPIVYLWLRRWGWGVFTQKSVYLFLAIALVPFGLWRWHILQHPEGMFGTSWLFNQGNIRFKGSFFRWLIFDRMNRLIFATGGFVLFWLGIIRGRNRTEGWFYFFWLLSIFIFFAVIAKGNVTHDYYQLPLVPIGCIFMAKGFEFLAMYGRGLKHRLVNFGLGLIFVAVMLAFGWYEVRGYFNINHPEIVEAGRAVDQLLPPEAKVIAPYESDSAFLYQTNRYGWTIGGGLIPEFIKKGATHLVSTNFDADTKYWMERCTVVERTDKWVIVDLTQCQEGFQDRLPTENEVVM